MDDNLKIREVIARYLGWTDIGLIGNILYEHDLLGIRPDNCFEPVPDYPNDIAAAWGLVEEVKAVDGWCPQIYWDDDDGNSEGFWVAEFNHYRKRGRLPPC